jgi:hypothetical protein
MQALAQGDLSQRARQRAAELARDADLRLKLGFDEQAILIARCGRTRCARIAMAQFCCGQLDRSIESSLSTPMYTRGRASALSSCCVPAFVRQRVDRHGQCRRQSHSPSDTSTTGVRAFGRRSSGLPNRSNIAFPERKPCAKKIPFLCPTALALKSTARYLVQNMIGVLVANGAMEGRPG